MYFLRGIATAAAVTVFMFIFDTLVTVVKAITILLKLSLIRNSIISEATVSASYSNEVVGCGEGFLFFYITVQ